MRGANAPRARRRRGEEGVSLIELVVALTIFAVFSAGVYAMLDSGLNLARNNRNRSIGANLASQEMDKVRSSDFADLPLGRVDSVQSVDGVNYTVRRESEWVPSDASGSACESGGSTPNYLRVTVFILWDQMRGVQPVSSSTILTPPVGAYDPNAGHVAVQVRDLNAEPAGGHIARVAGPGGTFNISTTSEGCAFFGYLAPGTYTVSMRTTGYVDAQGVEFPSRSVVVASGQIKSVEFDYDRASSVVVSLTAPEGGPIPNALPVTLGSTAFAPLGTRIFTGTGTTRTVANLFPVLSGYTAWAGSCADADAEGKEPIIVGPEAGGELPYWEGATRTEPVHAEPGSSANVTVELSTVNITVLRGTGNPVPEGGRTVRARHVADTGCPSPGIDMVLAGTTDAAGYLQTALPYGEWYFQVNNRSPIGSWTTYNVVIDPRAALPGDPAGPFDVVVRIQ